MAETLLNHQTHGSNTADRHQFVVHVDHDALAQSTDFVSGYKPSFKPDCYIENEVAIPIETARRLSCCSKIVAAVKDGGGYSVRRDDGLLIFTKPDGTEIEQVIQATTSSGPVKSNHEQPWQWNGDSMDYSVAMAGLASADGTTLIYP